MSSRPPQGRGGAAGPAPRPNGPMEPARRPPIPTRRSLLSARLVVRPVPWDAVRAISGGSRLDDWAADYPSEGDVIIAGLVVGGIGFFGPPREDGEVEVGYGIVPSRQGRGYATEALQAMLAMAWADPR